MAPTTNVDNTSSINDNIASGRRSSSDSSCDTSGSGWNRFEVLTQHRTNNNNKNKNDRRRKKSLRTAASATCTTTVILKTEKQHVFDYKFDLSRLYPHEPSICLDYTNSQSTFSLWKGMKDELRVLPTTTPILSSSSSSSQSISSYNKYDILIGLGSLNWSGGIYNCSPFCLYRKCK